MKLLLVNASVVVVGVDYAPNMITEDFLRKNKITKKGWELIEPPIVNVANSLWSYSNGMTIAVNQIRIQVVDGNPRVNLELSELGGTAMKLISGLPYARHTGLGINIGGFIELESATSILQEKFVKEGTWLTDNLAAISIGFNYPIKETSLNLSYSVGNVQLAGDVNMRSGVGITANYHTQIDTNLSLVAAARQAKDLIDQIPERYDDFVSRVRQVFDLEETE